MCAQTMVCSIVTIQRPQSGSMKKNLVLGLNTRELNRELYTELSIFYT